MITERTKTVNKFILFIKFTYYTLVYLIHRKGEECDEYGIEQSQSLLCNGFANFTLQDVYSRLNSD